MNPTPQDVLNDILGFNYLTKEEAQLLIWLAYVTRAPGQKIVNVGAGTGTSALALLIGAPDADLTTVDIAGDDNPFGGIFNERIPLTKAGILPGMEQAGRYHTIKCDSREVARAWTGGPIDLVFIDDGHEYDEALGDIQLWGAHLRPGGIIAVHDYKKEDVFRLKNPGVEITDKLRKEFIKPWPGVDLAVEFALINDPEFSHLRTVDSLTAWNFAP